MRFGTRGEGDPHSSPLGLQETVDTNPFHSKIFVYLYIYFPFIYSCIYINTYKTSLKADNKDWVGYLEFAIELRI